MIWCVEDDEAIRGVEMYTLETVGFQTRGFADGDACWKALQTETPQLVLLDVMLPGMDGTQLLKKIRETPSLRSLPVIMATAKGMEYDKIQSLDLGADDYMVKPFGMMEMVSRVRAVLRRCQPVVEEGLLRLGGLEVHPQRRTVTADGVKVQLTYKEFELLRLFLTHPGMIYTREQLFSDIWGMEYCGETRTVDMHIRTLRHKLGPYGNCIDTVRNVGYRLMDEK